MNCKPGDLAVRILTGQIVSVLRIHDDQNEAFVAVDGSLHGFWTIGFGFVVESLGGPLRTEDGTAFMCCPILSSGLRPLRDSDEPDETLTWAGKPVDVHAPIERLIPVNPLPHAVGGEPLRTWLGVPSTCGDSHAS